LAMAWREPMVSEEDLSPLERLRQEIKRPRTWNDIWLARSNELRERDDVELDEHADGFNLSNNTNNLEME
jgi:hypothetical protein